MNNQDDRFGYSVFWWSEDRMWIAQSVEFPSLSGVGETPDEALKEAQEVVRASVQSLEEDGEPVPQPVATREYKGKIALRIAPDTHRLVALQAAEAGLSINQYLSRLIDHNLFADSLRGQVQNLSSAVERLTTLIDTKPEEVFEAGLSIVATDQSDDGETVVSA